MKRHLATIDWIAITPLLLRYSIPLHAVPCKQWPPAPLGITTPRRCINAAAAAAAAAPAAAAAGGVHIRHAVLVCTPRVCRHPACGSSLDVQLMMQQPTYRHGHIAHGSVSNLQGATLLTSTSTTRYNSHCCFASASPSHGCAFASCRTACHMLPCLGTAWSHRAYSTPPPAMGY